MLLWPGWWEHGTRLLPGLEAHGIHWLGLPHPYGTVFQDSFPAQRVPRQVSCVGHGIAPPPFSPVCGRPSSRQSLMPGILSWLNSLPPGDVSPARSPHLEAVSGIFSPDLLTRLLPGEQILSRVLLTASIARLDGSKPLPPM